ncbi:amino acid permease [Wenyingzhuangia fucanilytica]|uniref:Amino acid permease n=1 Tax=Wenyingzhuangia fucanilytica TaxID=1790137 RepID=A0A1B1Y5W3_9FLAO|nr:amino acid permease [Wenyingzhuangia fucanilytica]ANW96153.1 amino acid permease [Wenyingzhuangia fucanilytica]
MQDLKRKVGVLGLSANIINTIVGAGIFSLPAIVAASLGSASIFAYLFCGVLVVLVMLCFAEVGSKVTSSGGVYAYLQAAFGPYFGFLTVILFAISTISADAAVTNAVADVLGSIFPFFKEPLIRILFCFLVFFGLGYINVRGVKEGINLVKFITITKLIPLLLLVLFSWGNISISSLTIEAIPNISTIGKVSLLLFFAFQGAESGLSISGEVINPKKNIPKAIFISITGVLILYILIQTVAQGVLGDSLPNFKENPLSEVAKNIVGPIGFTILTIGAAISMFGYLSSEILSIPRVLYGAAKDKVLPVDMLAKIHPKFKTPYISIIIYSFLGFVFATLGGFEQLAIFSSATILLVYLGVSLSVIKLRKDKTSDENNFKLPGGYLIPILSSLVIALLLANLSLHEVTSILVLILVLSIIYFLKKHQLK